MAIRNDLLTDATDSDLVLLALLGSLDAFDALVRRYRGAVVLTAEQTTGTRCGAEDVAQEVFLIAFKALPQLSDPAKFAGWLSAITRHRARRVARREGRHEPTEPSMLDRLILSHSDALSPAEALAREGDAERLRGALGDLPPEYRDVLRLRYWDEWPVARIAEFLALPVTTVKWRLHHGRERLRRVLTIERETDHD